MALAHYLVSWLEGLSTVAQRQVVTMLLARAGGKAARCSLAVVAASAGIGLLLHLGMIPFCGYLEWRALFTQQPLPDWMFQERH